MIAAILLAIILAGPIPAKVIDVYDGDTLTVRVHAWLDVVVTAKVRILGLDTPELRGKCDAEREAAIRARDALRHMAGEQVLLLNVRHDKYAGRVLADVVGASGDLAAFMIAAGHGRQYDGGARQGWCGD